MRCPHCNGIRNTVVNTDRKPGDVVVRRRLCLECKQVYRGVKQPGKPEFADRRTEPRRNLLDRRWVAPERRVVDDGRWGVRSRAAPELVAWLKKRIEE